MRLVRRRVNEEKRPKCKGSETYNKYMVDIFRRGGGGLRIWLVVLGAASASFVAIVIALLQLFCMI